jgi:hypothetical protein
MKNTAALIIAMLFFGSSMVCLAQMEGEKGSEQKGIMMGHDMKHPMMGKKMIATSDGGVIVMFCNKLYKYDKDLNLKKEVEIPMDVEHMKKMRMKMKEMEMMGGTSKKP